MQSRQFLQSAAVASAFIVSVAVPLRAQKGVSVTVDATMDIYQAGNNVDGSDGIAPAVYTFPARASQSITFPVVGGAWSCQRGYSEYNADGEIVGSCLDKYGPANQTSVGALSGYRTVDFTGGLAGVFLEDSLPKKFLPTLVFYENDKSEGGTSTKFRTLSPKIGQIFFIGDGLTGTNEGELQTFAVPTTATHLYLGYLDNCAIPDNLRPGCYSDNAGAINLSIRITESVEDWVEPTLSTAPSARVVPAMTHDPSLPGTLLFGGSSPFVPGPVYDDTWVWQGKWRQLFPANSPTGRGSAGLAYDPVSDTVVLFGGADNSNNGIALGDTWTFDGVTWTQQFPPISPAARAGEEMMVYDPATKTVLLFGGGGSDNGDYGGVVYGDTWEWNGATKTWTQLFPANSPSPRGAPLVYDAATGNVVLFGGANGGGDCCRVYYNDTWTWDGVNWTEQESANQPVARSCQALAYDEGLSQVVLYGGTDSPPGAFADTWEWNGVTWKQLSLPNSPSARYCSNMSHDPLSNGVVLFGGELSGDVATNQTWLLKAVPVL